MRPDLPAGQAARRYSWIGPPKRSTRSTVLVTLTQPGGDRAPDAQRPRRSTRGVILYASIPAFGARAESATVPERGFSVR